MIFSITVLFLLLDVVFFLFKQKTAYEMRISDWSSDVCSSDLLGLIGHQHQMIIVMRRETGHHRSVAGDVVDVGDALPAAVGPAIFIGGRQLAIAVGTDRQDELFLCGQ